MNYIIVDIDGTVADSRHRSHHIQLFPGKVVRRGDGCLGTITHVDHESGVQTLFNVSWMDDIIGTHEHGELWRWGNVDFDAWDADTMGDTPIDEVITVVHTLRALSPAVKVCFLTARGERARDLTEQWLTKYRLYHPDKGDLLLMRGLDDERKDTDLKRETILKMREEGHEFLFAFEDRRLVAQMMRELGIFVFHVADYD
jgi:hypothetical protein